jgi:hypothetical protein
VQPVGTLVKPLSPASAAGAAPSHQLLATHPNDVHSSATLSVSPMEVAAAGVVAMGISGLAIRRRRTRRRRYRTRLRLPPI